MFIYARMKCVLGVAKIIFRDYVTLDWYSIRTALILNIIIDSMSSSMDMIEL